MATKRRQPDDIEIVGIKRQTQLKPKGRIKKSKYAELVDKAARLRVGEVLEIAIAPGADREITRARISAVIRRKAQPLTDVHLKIRLTENDTIGIYAYEPRKRKR